MAGSDLRGTLITFEGLGGSGKSTMSRGVVAWLDAAGVPVVATHEPGGTPLGTQLRALLLESSQPPSPWAEAFLFEADRAETYARVIVPAIRAGMVVISDRSVYGTVAYQAFGRGLDLDLIDRMSRAATLRYWPDLVFILDIDPAVALARKLSRDADRFDEEDLAYQRRVRDGYLHAARRDSTRAYVLDADRPAEVILAEVTAVVAGRLSDRFPDLVQGIRT